MEHNRAANGRFLPGPSPDRHTFTRAERRRGYRRAKAVAEATGDGWGMTAWLYYRVRGYYRFKKGG
jgi:hypothetical protein